MDIQNATINATGQDTVQLNRGRGTPVKGGGAMKAYNIQVMGQRQTKCIGKQQVLLFIVTLSLTQFEIAPFILAFTREIEPRFVSTVNALNLN